MKEAGLLAALTMLITNGFLAPIVEEYAWRGMIQNRFRRAWGAVWAIIATALLFSLKQLLGDLSLARTTQVVVFAFVVCIVASR
jgi:membrane protease YdiL (CAAX protease family)